MKTSRANKFNGNKRITKTSMRVEHLYSNIGPKTTKFDLKAKAPLLGTFAAQKYIKHPLYFGTREEVEKTVFKEDKRKFSAPDEKTLFEIKSSAMFHEDGLLHNTRFEVKGPLYSEYANLDPYSKILLIYGSRISYATYDADLEYIREFIKKEPDEMVKAMIYMEHGKRYSDDKEFLVSEIKKYEPHSMIYNVIDFLLKEGEVKNALRNDRSVSGRHADQASSGIYSGFQQTCFFRHSAETYKEFHNILKELKNSGKPVKVWVPGISNGQELISLKISCLEDPEVKDINVDYIASDKNILCLAYLKRGQYGQVAGHPLGDDGEMFGLAMSREKIGKPTDYILNKYFKPAGERYGLELYQTNKKVLEGISYGFDNFYIPGMKVADKVDIAFYSAIDQYMSDQGRKNFVDRLISMKANYLFAQGLVKDINMFELMKNAGFSRQESGEGTFLFKR